MVYLSGLLDELLNILHAFTSARMLCVSRLVAAPKRQGIDVDLCKKLDWNYLDVLWVNGVQATRPATRPDTSESEEAEPGVWRPI